MSDALATRLRPAAARQPNYQATEAVGYGWRKFTASPSTLLVPALIAFLVILVIVEPSSTSCS